MKNERLRSALSLVSNLLIFVIVAVCIFALVFIPDRPDFLPRYKVFRYYTTLSNVLAALAAVPMAVCAVRSLAGGGDRVPKVLSLLRYMSVSALTLTMMTAFCFLGPLFGYTAVLTGANFWFHLIVPVLAIVSFLFFEPGADYPRKNPFAGIAGTLVYGAVYVRMVIFVGADRGGWPDFYGFNIGERWYVTVLVILAANLLFARLLLLGREKVSEGLRGDKD